MVSINGPGELDLETGMLVTSEVGNLHSEFGQATSYSLCTGRTDGRTDRQKQRLLPPYLRSGA